MRSDVRIGIAIGLVIILGVVVYFVLSNNGNNANPPAADNTEKKEPAGGVHKIRRVADNKIAARNGGSTSAGQASVTPPADPYAKIDSAKTELAPVGPGPAVVESAKPDTSKTDLAAAVEKAKSDLAKIESSKTDLAAVGPAKSDLAKTESVADLGGGASVRGASGVGAPAVDPIEERIRRRYDVEGTPSMGGGASADLRVTAPTVKPDAGFSEAGKGGVEVALVGSQKGAGLKAAGVGADSNLNKIEASKVESGYKAGPDPLLKSIDAADAGKPAVSDWVAKGQYEVQADDKEGAWGIARKVYKGNAKLHYLVIKANPGVDWNRLRPKQVLKILPPPDAAKTAVTPGAADPVAGNAAAPAAAVEEGKFTAPDEKGFRKYAVKKGDTGEKISKEAYGKAGHWGDIEKANPNVNAKRLSVKQVLVIPPLEKKAATTADSGLPGGVTGGTSGGVTGGVSGGATGGVPGGATGGAGVEEGKFTAPDEKGFRKYVVKKGDTGEKISKEAYGNGNHWGDIEKANPNVNAKRLSVKQVLVIPPVEKKAGDGASAAKDSGAPAGTVGQGGSGSAKQPKKKTTAKKTPAGKSGSGTGGETSGGTGGSSNGGGTGGSSGGARFD